MNVYDFDETIFNPDSSYLFSRFCLKKHPGLFWKVLPGVISKAVGKLIGLTGTTELKEKLFSYLSYLEDVDALVAEFWEANKGRIEPWYLERHREDDLIISASPEFLLAPICKQLGVRLLATRMDKHSGRISGENCGGEEKVRRLYEAFPDAVVDEFYSDSLRDTPLAKLANRAYRVDHDIIKPWTL